MKTNIDKNMYNKSTKSINDHYRSSITRIYEKGGLQHGIQKL